ncbi:MAG: LysR family transcriptional regulator [Pseudomonadota bacterium]
MILDFNHVRCFVTVAEELHFGRAAARLFMTQPPLSRNIQLLEHALGVTLLERTSRSVRLTAAGQVFLGDAIRILSFTEQAAASARRVGRGEAGRVTIGFTAVSGYELIPSLIAAARAALPEIAVVLKEMVSVAQIEALKANTIDLGFVRPLASQRALEHQLVAREALVLALPARHPLAARERIGIADLHCQPFIMYSQDEGKYFHDLITGLFGVSGVAPEYVQHVSQTHTVLALVRAGLGVGIVPASVRQFCAPDVVFKNMWRDDACAEMYMAWGPQRSNPALETFREFALAHFAAQRG